MGINIISKLALPQKFHGEIWPHLICLTLVVMPRLHASNAEQKPKHTDPFIIQFINLTFKDVRIGEILEI